jgi:hypothetical protein
MSAGFTPGPWELRPHSKVGPAQMYWVNEFTSVGSQVEADARLIAAAPDMFEALERIALGEEDVFDEDTGGMVRCDMLFEDIQKIAQAALAKARGEA